MERRRLIQLVGLSAATTPAAALPAVLTPLEAHGTPPKDAAPKTPRRGSFASARVTAVGQRVDTLFVDTGVDLLACTDLTRSVDVSRRLAGRDPLTLAVRRVVTRASATPGDAEQGRYLAIELAGPDEALPEPYALVRGTTQEMLFREYAADGSIVQKPRVQATSTPHFYGADLSFVVTLTGGLVRADDRFLAPTAFTVTTAPSSLLQPLVDEFTSGEEKGKEPGNVLAYRLRRPRGRGKRPLVIFLHGSGQVGTDNVAHLLSSPGAVGVLALDDAWVLAPQAPEVFDRFDSYDEGNGSGGGVHWQTRNRRRLLLALIRRLLRENPGIDADRVYVQGLSRGGEGALYLLMDAPELFAAAGIFSGREAGCVEWLDGRATPAMLRPALSVPLWFFHAVQDTVSPVAGTRRNVELLRGLRHRNLRYTELTRERPGDSGFVNTSAHNSWDLAYNSPAFWQWLLKQQRGRR